MGRPAKAVRALTEGEIAGLMYSARHYMNLKDNYLNLSVPGAAA
jgi:carbonic anhydrase/acetyltransferase-like protein (isoleucine patch superfamily)